MLIRTTMKPGKIPNSKWFYGNSTYLS